MKALVGAFNQEKALLGAFSVIVQPVVETMDHFTALVVIPAEQHTPGRGPGCMATPTVPQGVALLPFAISKCCTAPEPS